MCHIGLSDTVLFKKMGHVNVVNFNRLLCLEKRIRPKEIEFFLSFPFMYCSSKSAITERSSGYFLNKNLATRAPTMSHPPMNYKSALEVGTPAALTVGYCALLRDENQIPRNLNLFREKMPRLKHSGAS